MKEILNLQPRDDTYTKKGEILLHEKIHLEKLNKGIFSSNYKRINYLKKAESIIGMKIEGSVLEIGAGNGYMSIYIVKNREIDCVYVLECTINGVDKLIRKNFETNKINEQKYELVLGSFNSIPLKDKFDFVISFGAIHHSSNLQKTLDEIFKTLKPGGYMIAQEPFSNDKTQNSFFVKMKNKIVNVQGLVKIKNSSRDDNFFRKCEYLTASYHAGFEKVIFKKIFNFKTKILTSLNFLKNPINNCIIILKKSEFSTQEKPPNRWT